MATLVAKSKGLDGSGCILEAHESFERRLRGEGLVPQLLFDVFHFMSKLSQAVQSYCIVQIFIIPVNGLKRNVLQPGNKREPEIRVNMPKLSPLHEASHSTRGIVDRETENQRTDRRAHIATVMSALLRPHKKPVIELYVSVFRLRMFQELRIVMGN